MLVSYIAKKEIILLAYFIISLECFAKAKHWWRGAPSKRFIFLTICLIFYCQIVILKNNLECIGEMNCFALYLTYRRTWYTESCHRQLLNVSISCTYYNFHQWNMVPKLSVGLSRHKTKILLYLSYWVSKCFVMTFLLTFV